MFVRSVIFCSLDWIKYLFWSNVWRQKKSRNSSKLSASIKKQRYSSDLRNKTELIQSFDNWHKQNHHSIHLARKEQ